VAVLLIVGALALVGFNDVDWRVLFMIPFGLAWLLAGTALLRHEPDGARSTPA
jgi:O-antigen ligase